MDLAHGQVDRALATVDHHRIRGGEPGQRAPVGLLQGISGEGGEVVVVLLIVHPAPRQAARRVDKGDVVAVGRLVAQRLAPFDVVYFVGQRVGKRVQGLVVIELRDVHLRKLHAELKGLLKSGTHGLAHVEASPDDWNWVLQVDQVLNLPLG